MKRQLILTIVILLSGCALQQEARIQQAISLTPEHFSRTAEVKDSAIDVVATISTHKGFQEPDGLLGFVGSDNFLRAFIDKKTGHTTYQYYQVIYYRDSGWRFYNSVNYESPSGPKQLSATVVDRSVISCSGLRYGGCTYAEHVAFAADDELLNSIAKLYQPQTRTAWKVRFNAKSGGEYNGGMLPAEVAGFLDVVRGYRAGLGFK